MKWIKYDILQNTINIGTESDPIYEDVLLKKKVGYSEENLVIAVAEAYNGEYTIEEDSETFDKEPLDVELGGTGAKTGSQACENLGAVKKSGDTMTGRLVSKKVNNGQGEWYKNHTSSKDSGSVMADKSSTGKEARIIINALNQKIYAAFSDSSLQSLYELYGEHNASALVERLKGAMTTVVDVDEYSDVEPGDPIVLVPIGWGSPAPESTHGLEYRFAEPVDSSITISISQFTGFGYGDIMHTRVMFKTDSTAPFFSLNNSDPVFLSGEDCSNGVFTPEANKAYEVDFRWTGRFLKVEVCGVALT